MIGGVGQRLLIAGHPGGEHRLAERLPPRAVRVSGERPTVLQDEDGLAAHRVTASRTAPSPTVNRPRSTVAISLARSVPPANGALADFKASDPGSTVRLAA